MTEFKKYIEDIGLFYEYSAFNGEFVVGSKVVLASIPMHMVQHNLLVAKELIKVGLDLHNCFTR